MNTKDERAIQNQYRELLLNDYPDFQIDNQSYMNMFYYECMRFTDEIGPERIDQLRSVFDVQSFDNVEESQPQTSKIVTPHSNNYQSYLPANGSDFFAILESAIREADRKWREDEFKQQHKNKKKKRQRGMDR
jgi:hypothetical protein